jgi:hypothetical protein
MLLNQGRQPVSSIAGSILRILVRRFVKSWYGSCHILACQRWRVNVQVVAVAMSLLMQDTLGRVCLQLQSVGMSSLPRQLTQS